MNSKLWVVTPFEVPDVNLVVSSAKLGAFPVLHLGRDPKVAKEVLKELSQKMTESFGVCVADASMSKLQFPKQVSAIIAPWGVPIAANKKSEVIWQVHSIKEAEEALKEKVKKLIIKGSEGGGYCGEDSSFLLFQRLIAACQKENSSVYIQGGVGVHTAAAYFALGAAGIVLDSQVALLPECSAPQELKNALTRLNGSEIHSCEGYRYYVRPGATHPDPDAKLSELLPLMGVDASMPYLPVGQDVILSADYAEKYKKLRYLIPAFEKAIFSHIKLAKSQDILSANSDMTEFIGSKYPLAQGPMARISDVPEFLKDVSDAGALPFFAMSMMVGDPAEKALTETAEKMQGQSWGVGMLGFIYPKVLEEQTQLILKAKPDVVLIAGGRPDQAKPFEAAGIKVFLHVPVAGLLDMFLKEGARSFIFEGRESGGHVGPLHSTVLWEKQINRLLRQEDLASLKVFFAGGIHDAFSAAFVRIMAAPLSARDVGVGLLLGTAYLYTEEIVKRGAITGDYQKLLVKQQETLLLKSGTGQETRSVASPFTDFFLSEKERMKNEGMESTEILMKLEDLNLGRLRIAAKGVERKGDKLVTLTKNEQLKNGLYMTGATTALISNTTTIPTIHNALTEGSRKLLEEIEIPTTPDAKVSIVQADVAVVGMACIFPDAANLDEYWRNILFGKDSISEVDEKRWSPALFFDPDTKDTDHVVSKWGGFIGSSDFDAFEFGITPQSLAAIEPVQLLSLLMTKRALEDAGYTDLSKVDLDDTSVIFGAQGAGELSAGYGSRSGLMAFFGSLLPEAEAVLPRLTEDSFPGVLTNVISGRISNRLNTGGRNYTVDAACASSLAALDVAYSELASGKSDMVVLGGADLHNGINDFLMFSSTYALSKKGRCSTFDEEADGIALGEGVAVVVLKRLEDAERDGNKIYAVIRGIGGSSDGKSLGLTAPGKGGQVKALERAYSIAGIAPSEVGLVEAHGTGTVVGDRTELGALTDVFLESGAMPGQTRLGSVKTQIGHTKCAAGMAGLIKAILSVQHGLLPPTLNLKKPNEAYSKSSPFAFRTEKTGFWKNARRIAGVSGFGFGGTNFHAIIENYDKEIPATTIKAWPSELFIFRGDTVDEAEELLKKTKALLEINDKLRLRDIAFSLSAYSKKPVQYAIVADNRTNLLNLIDLTLAEKPHANIYPLKPIDGKVAFLFPGQGSQRVNMAADLFMVFPEMRRLLDTHPQYEEILFPDSVFSVEEKKAQRARITDTRNAQPLLGLVDLAIAEQLRDFGVVADMAAGHSYGEIPALCFADAFDASHLLELSRNRAKSILQAVGEDPGRMVAVHTDKTSLDELISDETTVWAVNFNSPKQTVVAGTSDGIETFLKKLDEAKVPYSELNVACAFHSPLLADAEGLFAAVLKDINFRKPKLTVWSNTNADIYPTTAVGIRKRLSEHLVNPVRFTEEAEKMYEKGARIFIEAGPGSVQTELVGAILKEKDITLIRTERGDVEGLSYFLHGLAQYIATGREIKMEKLFEGRDVEQLNIDEPEQYKKRGTVWNVDGRSALPETGDLPSHAGKQFYTPLMSIDQLRKNFAGANAESIMMAYLDNMNAVIQDQRDVLLGYLGQPDLIPRSQIAPRQFALTQGNDVASASSTPATVVQGEIVSETEGAELPQIQSLSTEEITEIILNVVSDKTGYPIDMLGLDVDLEADLSIDSIKKMEIIGGLRDHVSFPENDDMEESFEKMISIKTLQGLIEWITELGSLTSEAKSKADSGFAGASALDVSAAIPSGKSDVADIVRMTLNAVDRPIETTDESLLKGKSFAVTEDGKGLTAAVIEALTAMGAKAEAINGSEKDLSAYDGLILINANASSAHYTIHDLFQMIKSADMEKLQWIYTFDDIPAALLRAKTLAKIGLIEGFAGFFKALFHEYPGKRLGAVTFQTAIEAKNFGSLVIRELTNEKPFPEVYYKGQKRFYLLPEIDDPTVTKEETIDLSLTPEANVIVLGGAQGITPSLVAQLATDCPCRYILVGRSALSTESEKYKELKTVDEIRKYLIEKEEMKQPKEIEKKSKTIFKENQIGEAIALIEKSGAKVEYHSVDVQDSAALRTFVKKIKEEYGSVDGVIHAAGILEDKLFHDKEADSFKRVYSTKVAPLAVILKELLPELKLLVMFSSTSSSFGNAGQCDYSAGNSVMDVVSRIMKEKYPETKTIAFNWGPWKGAGMVNVGLENEFRKKGIAFLRLEEGSKFFAREVRISNAPGVIAMGGDAKELEGFIEATLGH
jgi:acyl transferase domain-containing protein/NAD(P)H-dependent flavin oxidoreductase YrpB (nitropropane dioxygenase family)/NAD(P)-dependent dehydrogenase (short-subunit alcohol dehydrogenase family)